MIRLKAILILIGGLLGPLNLSLFFLIGSKINSIPFYEKMTNSEVFVLFGGFWFLLMFVPCLISTGLTLFFLWRPLLDAKTKRQHILWGMKFGGTATVFSTAVFIFLGTIFNYEHGILYGMDMLWALVLAIPSGLMLGSIFVILFSPAIFIAGPIYGLTAMTLKEKVMNDLI
jgi:hypothetical protein